jgi:hypothetical protein
MSYSEGKIKTYDVFRHVPVLRFNNKFHGRVLAIVIDSKWFSSCHHYCLILRDEEMLINGPIELQA